LFSFLIGKAKVPARVLIDGRTIAAPVFIPDEPPPAKRALVSPPPVRLEDEAMVEIPLIALAHGRSGDKGDIANIGVLARAPEFVPTLRRNLTADAVGDYFAHFIKGKVERFEWPGLDAFNFLLHESLGGGGVASLRHDPQGKALAQILMDMPIRAPARWLNAGGPLAGWAEFSPDPRQTAEAGV
jgi:hypothetical protein